MPQNPMTNITYAGPPTAAPFGAAAVGDMVVDINDVTWECTVAGSPGTWIAPSGQVASALTLVSGTAVQSNTPTKPSTVHFSATTTGAATITVAIGPTSGVANQIYAAAFATGVTVPFSVPLPTGWYIKVTLVNATMVAGISVG